MKALSGTRIYIGLAALALGAVVAFQALAQQKPLPTAPPVPAKDQAKFVLMIRDITPTKGNQAEFERVLDQLHTKLYDLYTDDENGQRKHHTPGSHKVVINTDKVTVPESANSDKGGELTYIGTRTTIQVPSMDSSDIKNVVDQLQ